MDEAWWGWWWLRLIRSWGWNHPIQDPFWTLCSSHWLPPLKSPHHDKNFHLLNCRFRLPLHLMAVARLPAQFATFSSNIIHRHHHHPKGEKKKREKEFNISLHSNEWSARGQIKWRPRNMTPFIVCSPVVSKSFNSFTFPKSHHCSNEH